MSGSPYAPSQPSPAVAAKEGESLFVQTFFHPSSRAREGSRLVIENKKFSRLLRLNFLNIFAFIFHQKHSDYSAGFNLLLYENSFKYFLFTEFRTFSLVKSYQFVVNFGFFS